MVIVSEIRILRILVLWAGLIPCLVQALEDVESIPEPAPVVESDEITSESPLEEVVVIGRETLNSLREELRQAQDHVYDLFNTLNDDDEYDIHCHMETRTGTHISRRVCKANYVDEATSIQGEAYIAFLRGEPGSAQMPATAAIELKNRILREKLTELVNANAELREAVTGFAELSENYENARQQIRHSRE